MSRVRQNLCIQSEILVVIYNNIGTYPVLLLPCKTMILSSFLSHRSSRLQKCFIGRVLLRYSRSRLSSPVRQTSVFIRSFEK